MGRNYRNKPIDDEEEEEEEELSFFQAHKKVIISGIIAVAFLVIFLVTLFITLGVANSSSPKDVQIPNVVGKSQEEAKREIEGLNLKYTVSKEI